jgi:perosamine synthetase
MGEGGFVACRSKDLADRLKIIRDHGMDRNKRYWHHVVGFNFRLTNMQAAMGVAQLENAGYIVAAHDKVVGMYKERLEGLNGVTFQRITGSVSPVIWTVAVKLEPRAFRVSRDGVIKKLAAKGIETRPGFYSFRAMPAYRAGRLKVSEDVGSKLICLPTYSSISERDVDMVCGALKSLMR